MGTKVPLRTRILVDTYSIWVVQVLHIYIFGGKAADTFYGKLKKYEMIELNNPSWKALPDMREALEKAEVCLMSGVLFNPWSYVGFQVSGGPQT